MSNGMHKVIIIMIVSFNRFINMGQLRKKKLMDHYIKINCNPGVQFLLIFHIQEYECIKFSFSLMMRMKFTGKFSKGVLY